MSDESFKKISGDMAGRSGWGSSLIIVIVIALIASLSTWSTYAELDNVARGEGRIISPIQNQSVQAGEGGIILRRYVSENSSVARGDLLFEIDPIDASSELNQMSKRFAGLEIRELRLRAEIAGREQFAVPQSLSAQTPTVALSEESLFVARRLEVQGQVNVLEQRLARSGQDVIAGEVGVASAGRTMVLIEDEIAVVEPLVREKIASAPVSWGCNANLSRPAGPATVRASQFGRRAWQFKKLTVK